MVAARWNARRRGVDADVRKEKTGTHTHGWEQRVHVPRSTIQHPETLTVVYDAKVQAFHIK